MGLVGVEEEEKKKFFGLIFGPSSLCSINQSAAVAINREGPFFGHKKGLYFIENCVKYFWSLIEYF